MDDRTLLVRRGAAAGIALLVLVGIVFAVKAILDRQALNAIRNYRDEVSQIVNSEQSNVRTGVFRTIDNSFSSSNTIDVQNNLQQYIGQVQSDYRTAQGWSVPAEMVGAQRYFVEALGLRYEALQGLDAEMRQALGVGDQARAVHLIAGDMEKLLTADVLYSDRVKPLADEALARAGVAGVLPAASFLPDVGWIDPETVAQRILGYVPAAMGGTPPNGALVGHYLQGVQVRTASGSTTTLSTSGINHIPYSASGVTFVLQVVNDGAVDEHDVQTKVTFTKAGLSTSCLTSTSAIRTTAPGRSYNSAILFAPTCASFTPYYGQVMIMKAGVQPVPGESDRANNYMTFDVEFAH